MKKLLIIITLLATCSLAATPELKFKWFAKNMGINADLVIKNTNDYDIKDLTLKCNFYAESGTRLTSSSKTIYQLFKKGQTKTFKNYKILMFGEDFGKVGCQIAGFKKV